MPIRELPYERLEKYCVLPGHEAGAGMQLPSLAGSERQPLPTLLPAPQLPGSAGHCPRLTMNPLKYFLFPAVSIRRAVKFPFLTGIHCITS